MPIRAQFKLAQFYWASFENRRSLEIAAHDNRWREKKTKPDFN